MKIINRLLGLKFKKYCHRYKSMETYYLGCRKHTGNIGLKKVVMTNKVIRDKSRYANCMADKLRSLKHNKKSSWNNINPKIFIH